MSDDDGAIVKRENRRERRAKEGKKAKSGVDNTFRRTWDKDDYEDKAVAREKADQEVEESALDAKRRKRLERDPLHQGIIVERAKLKQRDFSLDLTSRLGKSQVITNTTPLNQQAGYYCSVCDCILRDSMSYLDHINGKYHNRALGMTMRVERSNADQIRQRFEALKQKKYESEQVDTVLDGFDRRVLEAQEEEERQREERKAAKRRKKRGEDEEEEEEDEFAADPDMAMAMGFAGFGGSR